MQHLKAETRSSFSSCHSRYLPLFSPFLSLSTSSSLHFFSPLLYLPRSLSPPAPSLHGRAIEINLALSSSPFIPFPLSSSRARILLAKFPRSAALARPYVELALSAASAKTTISTSRTLRSLTHTRRLSFSLSCFNGQLLATVLYVCMHVRACVCASEVQKSMP